MKIVTRMVIAALIGSFTVAASASEEVEFVEAEDAVVDFEALLLDPAMDQFLFQANSIAVSIKNKCYDNAYVAAHYKDLDGTWLTKGWWKVEAFSESTIFYTKNRILYYTAQSENGNHKWTGDDAYFSVRGSETKYGFKRKVGPSTFRPYAISLTCNG